MGVASEPSCGAGHSRLLRRVLLVSSLLTLAGLHVPDAQLPDVWRAARLVPVAFGVAGPLANVAAVLVSSGSAGEALAALPFGILTLHTLLALVHLLRRRRQLHVILLKTAAVEQATACCSKASDFTYFRWKIAVAFGITVGTAALWIASFLTGGDLKPPNYLFPVLLPVALRGDDMFWTVNGLELVVVVISFTVQCVSDLLMIGLADAVTVAQLRLTRFVKRSSGHPPEDELGDHQKPVWSVDKWSDGSSSDREGEQSFSTVAVDIQPVTAFRGNQVGPADAQRSPSIQRAYTTHHQKTTQQPDSVSAPTTTCPTLKQSDPGDVAERLRMTAEAYRAVHSLATESAELCSLPTLTQHASVTLILLIGLYTTISGIQKESAIVFSSFALFLLLNVLRLAGVSSMGSRLIDSGESLSTALVFWRRPLSGQLQFQLQMLIEHTRKPLTFNGYGIFVTQKETMLSLMSFILTYFVILIQIGV